MADESTVPSTEEESGEVIEEVVTEAVPVGTVPVAIGYESISNKMVDIAREITDLDKDLSAHLGIMAEIENRAKAHSRSVSVKSFYGGENTAFTLSTNMSVGEY